jgi:hypothetical protein
LAGALAFATKWKQRSDDVGVVIVELRGLFITLSRSPACANG